MALGEQICLACPGWEMMAGDWVQPSPTTSFNFLPNLFASLRAPETTLLTLQQRLVAELWDTQVCSNSEFTGSFLAPSSYLSSHLRRMLQLNWWNYLLKLLCGQILFLFFLQRCHILHLTWMIKILFLSAVCFGHLFSERDLGTYQSFSFSSAPMSWLQWGRSQQRPSGSRVGNSGPSLQDKLLQVPPDSLLGATGMENYLSQRFSPKCCSSTLYLARHWRTVQTAPAHGQWTCSLGISTATGIGSKPWGR